MKYLIAILSLVFVCVILSAPPGTPTAGDIRMNADTTDTNTQSARITITQYTNLNSATVTATNWVQVGILGEDGIITLSSSDGTNSVDITMDSAGQFRIEPTTPDNEAAFVFNMTTPHTVGPSLQIQNNGNIIFSVDSNSGWTNSGTLFFSDRGRFEATGGGGTTINPTDTFIPYRSDGTTFVDSTLFQLSSSRLVNTNASFVTSKAISSGNNVDVVWGGAPVNEALVAIRVNGVNGDSGVPEIWLSANTSTNFTADYGFIDLSPDSIGPTLTVGNVIGTTNYSVLMFAGSSKICVQYGIGANSCQDIAGTGNPEGAVTANIGSTYRRFDGGAGTAYYVKESGNGANTGWVGK